MKATGMVIGFVDVPRENEAAYARWADSDHVPEIAARPGVIAGRRYHAADDIMAFRASKEGAPPVGEARYCTIYLLGDPDVARVQRELQEFGARLAAAGRAPGYGKLVFANAYRLTGAFLPTTSRVSADAAPFLVHRGIQVATGWVPDPVDVAEATEWWASSHYPDMVSVPGWAAALRFEPAGEEGRGKFLHLFLLDRPSLEAHGELEKVLPEWRRTGRSPHPRGIYRRTFSGPWNSVVA